MNNAAHTLVATNPLVVTGKTQRGFQDGVCYETEANLLAAKRELEQSLNAEQVRGTSRFSDIVQGLMTKLTILNANLSHMS